MVEVFYIILISQKFDQKPTILKGGHGRPRRSGVKVDPGRHRGQATRYKAHFHHRAQKEKKENVPLLQFHYSFFFLFFLLREKFGCRCWCGLRHCWRVVVAVSPWVFPGFARLGKLSQTSDRLYSCGFADRQSRPWSATGAGGFEVLIANCKLQITGHIWSGTTDVARDFQRPACKAASGKFLGQLSQTSGRLHSHGPGDWRRFFRCGGGGYLLMGLGSQKKSGN